jgi:hypothetical protein
MREFIMSADLLCLCGKRLRSSAETAGGQGRCPACGRILDIPAVEPIMPSVAGFPPSTASSTALTDEPGRETTERTAVTDAASELAKDEAIVGQPNEVVEITRPSYQLASPGQVGWTAFLGGPLAGFLLMGRNYAKCGRALACWMTISTGVMLTAAVVGSGFLLRDSNPVGNLCIAAPVWLATCLTARILQQRMFEIHCKHGGERASGGIIVGFIVLGIALTLVGSVGAAVLYETGFGDQRFQVTAREEIYYSRDISETEVRTVARVLQAQKLFDGAGEKSVRLHKEGSECVLSLVLLFGFDDARLDQELRTLAREISRALGGKPVKIEVCDQWGTAKKKLPVEIQGGPLVK